MEGRRAGGIALERPVDEGCEGGKVRPSLRVGCGEGGEGSGLAIQREREKTAKKGYAGGGGKGA